MLTSTAARTRTAVRIDRLSLVFNGTHPSLFGCRTFHQSPLRPIYNVYTHNRPTSLPSKSLHHRNPHLCSFAQSSTMYTLQPDFTAQPSEAGGSPLVHAFSDTPTSTWTFVVVDPATKDAFVIDSVLEFDAASGHIGALALKQVGHDYEPRLMN
jgi:hypothetical protein